MQTNIFVDKKERTGKPHELFGIWMATQIGILGLIYGAIIVSYELSFIQSILAAFVGALSYFSWIFKSIWKNRRNHYV